MQPPSPKAAFALRGTFRTVALEGILTVAFLLGTSFPGGEGELASGGGLARMAAGLTLGIALVSAWAAWKASRDERWLQQVVAWLRRLVSSETRLVIAVATFYLSALLLLVAWMGVSLRMNPDPQVLLAAFLSRGLMGGVYVCLVCLHAVLVFHALAGRSTLHALRNLSVGGLFTFLLLAYWYGAEGQLLKFNVDITLTDQRSYMDYARRLVASGYTYPGDFNRMPIYPLLLSLVWRPGMTEGQFWLASKYFNLFLSMLLLVGLAVIFFRRYDRLWAINLILIVTFTVFIYKAGWVQAELLLYFLNTCLFLLLWRLLQRPDLRMAALAGLVAGLAHLTKASLWPALAVFGVFSLAQGLRDLARPDREREPPGSGLARWRALMVVPVLTAVFLAVLAPYFRVAHQITGHYFYNVNSTFYMWYDSWEEAKAGTRAHGDRVGWPEMPASEIPSLGKYVKEHSLAQMVERVVLGGKEVMAHVRASYGYADYILVYAGLVFSVAIVRWRRTKALVAANALLILYFIAYFVSYGILYFWYAPIAAGDRLILAQFLPLLLVLTGALFVLLQGDRLSIGGRTISWWTVVNWGILIWISTDAVWALREGVYVLRGGG